MENISKEYFGNRVLNQVSLQVRPGEIHALMGENGPKVNVDEYSLECLLSTVRRLDGTMIAEKK